MRRRLPGELLLHPVSLLAVVILIFNDHWLKGHWPGDISHQISNFAGLVIFPVLLCSLLEFVRALRRAAVVRHFDAALWTAVCGVGFVFVKTTVAGHDAYVWTVAAIRWPYMALTHPAFRDLRPIVVWRDPVDLLALLVLPLTYWLIARHFRQVAGLPQPR